MTAQTKAAYRFLPFLREGLASLRKAAASTARPALQIDLRAGSSSIASALSFELLAAGDVRAIDPASVVRQQPPPDTPRCPTANRPTLTVRPSTPLPKSRTSPVVRR